MKATRRKTVIAVLLTAAAMLLAPMGAAASTQPCTQVSNQATLSYSVGGIGQTDITSALGPANQFYVGVKVMVTVATQDLAEVSVTPGVTVSVLEFVVQNNGNAVHDYALAFSAAANGIPSPFGGGNDSFDAGGGKIAVYIDDGDGSYDAGDTAATSINDLARDGGTATVFLVYTPDTLGAANGAIAVYYLTATTQWANGNAIGAQGAQTPSAVQAGGACDGTRTVDVVFGDVDGPGSADGNRDAAHTDDSAYIVANAAISVTKSYSVVSDPINSSAPYSAIPGAVVRYSVAIANTGGSSAVLTTISDVLNGNLQIVSTANNATWTATGSTRATTSGTLTADANSGDGLDHSAPAAPGGTLTATIGTFLAADAGNGYAAGELKSGETLTLTFDATIQ